MTGMELNALIDERAKKQIEEARIRNIRENGKYYTKKQLKEYFRNDKKA